MIPPKSITKSQTLQILFFPLYDFPVSSLFEELNQA